MDELKEHERANRELWNRQSDEYQAGHGVPISAAPDAWGSWRIPESQLRILPDVRGLDVLELGCGGGQWTAWLAEHGATVTGIDISERQLEHARRLLATKGVDARLVPGSAENLPFEAQTFDLIISDHGAMSWADPARTVPEAARVLRPGGTLIFCATSVLMLLVGWDDEAGPTDRLERDYFALTSLSEGEGAYTFSRPHSEWIRLFRDNGLAIEALHEPRPEENAVSTFYPAPTSTWARRWPAEAIWVVRREASADDGRGRRQLQRMLAYHAWATIRLIDFCRGLDSEQLQLTAAGTTGSVERTLTHLVSSEQFYLRDLTGYDPPTWIENSIVSLDELAARAAENAARWTDYLNQNHEPDDAYTTGWRGTPKAVVRWGTLTQTIAHGAEHRTHVGSVLGANGIEPPDLSVGAYEDAIGSRDAC